MKKRKGQQQGRNSAGLVTAPTGDIRIRWIFILVKKKNRYPSVIFLHFGEEGGGGEEGERY